MRLICCAYASIIAIFSLHYMNLYYVKIYYEHRYINVTYVSLLSYSSDTLHIDKQNADAIYIRGMCLYFQDDIDRAFAHFQHVLRLAPDHAKALEIYKVARRKHWKSILYI